MKGDRGYDILGSVAIVKFDRDSSLADKKKFAMRFLKQHANVTSVLEKSSRIKGRLRTGKTKFVFGINTKETLYRENGCEFMFDVDKCYFSPRLASERKEIAELVKKGRDKKVLVMFGGVGVYAVVIAKLSKVKRVVSVELGKECNKYAQINVKRNKLRDSAGVIQGDVRKKVPLLNEKFDRIVMARPNLEDSFLDVAFKAIRRGGMIHYYGFYSEDEIDKMNELIFNEAKKAKKKIKIIRVKRAGDIGIRKFRYRADIKVL